MKQRIIILLFAFALCATGYSFAQEVILGEEPGKTDVVRTDSTGLDRTQVGDTTWTDEDEIYQGDTIYFHRSHHHSSLLKRHHHRHHGKTMFEKSQERRHKAKQKKAREARRERMSHKHRSTHHASHHSTHHSSHSTHHTSHHSGRR